MQGVNNPISSPTGPTFTDFNRMPILPELFHPLGLTTVGLEGCESVCHSVDVRDRPEAGK
jgi:hypothetical protein